MKARTVWFAAALTMAVLGFSPPGQAQTPTNLLASNSGFETGAMAPWGSYGALATFTVVKDCVGAVVPQGPIEGNYCLNVKVSGAGANRWDAAFQAPMATPPGTVFQKGKAYTFSIFLKSKSGAAQVYISAELSQDPYTAYGTLAVTMTDTWAEYHFTTAAMPVDVNPAHLTIHVAYAAQEFWVDDAKWYEGNYVPTVTKDKISAIEPTPDNNATDVPRDQTLSWKAGPFAATHNVYLGTRFEDVNTADINKAVSQGQTETTFQPPDLLEYGKVYYWRVDEVNAPPSNTVVKGDVWSFTAEPYLYALTGVTATASSASTSLGMTAAKTVDGSGLTDGLHSNTDVDGWLTEKFTKLPATIRFDFGRACVIRDMKVWNSNQKLEGVFGFGARSVLIDYLATDATWKTLKTVEFPQADATSTYAGFTVDMNDVLASSVRLTIQTNWSPYFLQQTGLSEVRFNYIAVQARQPSPAANAEGVPVDTTFNWREGRQAASHRVYFSADRQAVVDGASPTVTADNSFQPSSLSFGDRYYWRVDEVNDAAAIPLWTGDIWSFVTAEWTPIDGFEAYSNSSPNRVFQTWVDGWGFSKDDFFPDGNPGNGSGSMVGYDPALGDIMESAIVHGGAKSVPVEYNNVSAPYYSEINRTWETPQDWTANGATDISLWFQGNPAAFIESASGVTMSGGGADIYNATDECRFTYKKLTGDGSIVVRLDSAKTMATWTKTGVTMRSSLEPMAAQAHIVAAAAQTLVEWQYRSNAGNATTTQFNTTAGTNPLPVWLRLTRAGSVFTGEYSADGKTWTKITATDGSTSSTTVTMPSTVYVGMVVCANAAGKLAIAEFSQIKTTGTVAGQWQATNVGVEQASNDPDTLYVAVQDSAGKSKTIVHPNAGATCLSEWTEWRIGIKDFTGVKMNAVKKMTIGVGNNAQPKPSGVGRLFFDDIQYGRPIIPVGLVAQYSLEDNVDDSSGNGHNGVIVGEPVFVNGPTGKGKAIQFNGQVGQYVDLGTFNPSDETGKLSVSLWANWKGATGLYQGLIAKRNIWAANEMMWQIEANNAAGALTFGRTDSYPGSGNPILPIGEWTHVAVTFDKTTARFYVNGTKTGEGAFSFGSDPAAAVHVGCCNANGENPFNGAIDEVRLYDTVLTDAEVRALAGK